MATKPRAGSKNTANPAHEAKIAGLRAALVAIEAAVGASISEIATRYRLSDRQTRADLSLAREAGFIDAYKTALHEQLLPKALAVVDAQLSLGNYDAARDLLQGLGVYQRNVDASKLKGKVAEQTLEAYKAERQRAIRPGPPEDLPDEERGSGSHRH